MTKTTETVRNFLLGTPAISTRAIEKECRIPPHTLQKVKQGRDLPEKHRDVVLQVLQKYGLHKPES